MILENKFLHAKKQKKQLIIIILIVFFLLLFSFILLFFNGKSNSQLKNIYTGGVFSGDFSGKLVVENNYPLYTHSLVSGETKYYLKSSSVNLNIFLGDNVVVGGKIFDFYKKSPVINVQLAHSLNKKYIIKDRYYIFPQNFFLLDIAENKNISVNHKANEIEVFYDGKFAFKIKSFVCNKIIPHQDCEGMRKKLIADYVDTFKSPLGYQFFQSENDNHWYVLEKNAPIGYLFTTSHDDYLVDLSYIFSPIDGKLIRNTQKNIIHSTCLSTGDEIISVPDTQQSIVGDKYLKIIYSLFIETVEKKQKMVDCNLMFNVFDLSYWSK